MAVKTKDLIIDIDDMSADLTITKPNKSALYFKNKSYADAVTSVSVAANKNDLVILLTNGYKITLTDYVKQNGKNAVKYIKTDEETGDGFLQNLIDLGMVSITNPIAVPQKGNTFTGTMFNDIITGTANADVIKAMDGNDVVTGSAGNDSITGGKGTNSIVYTAANFGNDIITLTKNEVLHISGLDFTDIEAQNRFKQGEKAKNDLVITTKYGTITLKNYLGKDLGATVTIDGVENELPIEQINLAQNAEMTLINAINYFAIEGKKVQPKYTGTALADRVFAANLANPTSVKNIKGVEVKNGVTINTGLGDDIISGSKFNDTITAGKGSNTIDYSVFQTITDGKITATENFGNDVITLTKGETLTIKGLYFGPESSSTTEYIPVAQKTYYEKNKNDLIIHAVNGTVTLKNYLSKDLGATVYIKGVIDTYPEGDAVELGAINLADRVTTSQIFDTVTKNDFVKNKYTGTALTDVIDATGITGTGKDGKTGATILAGAGNDKITGSELKDTIKGEAGNDRIFGSLGADTITGGIGENRITYTAINQLDGDTIILTKNENLEINVDGIADATVTSKVVKNDLLVTVKKGENTGTFTIKNFGTKDVVGEAGSVILRTTAGDIDLKTASINDEETPITVEKSYKGSYHSELISGATAEKGVNIDGGAGNDVIFGSKFNDTLKAGTGNDTIYSYTGDDKLYSGTSAESKTTFVFERHPVMIGDPIKGDGKDTIIQGKGEDTINLSDFSIADVKFTQNKKDLVITYVQNEDEELVSSVTVKNYYKSAKSNDPATYNSVKNIVFSEGAFLLEKFACPNEAESGAKNGYIEGTAEADNLIGGSTNDVIYGKEGNDTINAGGGRNKIIYNLGNGEDTIISGNGEDTIVFGDGIELYGVGKQIMGDDVWIWAGDDAICLKDANTLEGGHSVKFVNVEGTTVSVDDLPNYISGDSAVTNGTDGNDVITPTYQHQGNVYATVNAGAGNDIIRITSLSDNPTINVGAGNDTISVEANKSFNVNYSAGDGNNTIQFNEYCSRNIYINNPDNSLFQTIDLDGWDYKYIASRKEGNDLILISSNGQEEFTIKNYYDEDIFKGKIYAQGSNSINYNIKNYNVNTSDIVDFDGDEFSQDDKLVKCITTSGNKNLTISGDNNTVFQYGKGAGAGTQATTIAGLGNTVYVNNQSSSQHNIVNINGYSNIVSLYANTYSTVELGEDADFNTVYLESGGETNANQVTTNMNKYYNYVITQNSGGKNTIRSNGIDGIELCEGTNDVYLETNSSYKLIDSYYGSHNKVYVSEDNTEGDIEIRQFTTGTPWGGEIPHEAYFTHYHNEDAINNDGEDFITFGLTKEDGSIFSTDEIDLKLYGKWDSGTFSLDTEEFDNRFIFSGVEENGYHGTEELKLSQMTQLVDMASTEADHDYNIASGILNLAKDVYVKGTNSNDTYTISSVNAIAGTGKQYTIQETGGTDSLVISQDKSKFRFFFDVSKTGAVGNDLYIFQVKGTDGGDYESELDRFIRQGQYKQEDDYREANFICLKDANTSASASMEKIQTTTQEVGTAQINTYIDTIKESIQNWLVAYNTSEGTEYGTVMEAIQDGAGTSTLFQKYTGDVVDTWNSIWVNS